MEEVGFHSLSTLVAFGPGSPPLRRAGRSEEGAPFMDRRQFCSPPQRNVVERRVVARFEKFTSYTFKKRLYNFFG